MEDIKVDNKITVLGKTFNTEEERRNYFRDELRKKLPELKQMEGFPIGEDEDIINLSDPPYYTACPNPWLNDFISEWEAEKKQLEKNGKRDANFEVDEPYASDISVGKNHFMYKAQTYHTKVPHQAIMKFLMYYTQPGDIIYDGFAGTGMLGLASSLCEYPEPDVKLIIENELSLKNSKANWGLRRSINNDLSPIASFIAYNYISEHDSLEFKVKVDELIKNFLNELGWLYETKHSNGDKALINYVVWSDIFGCPNCNSEIIFWDGFIDHESKSTRDLIKCEKCGSTNQKKDLLKLDITTYDKVLNKSIKLKKRAPVLIHYKYLNKTYLKKPDSFDMELIDKIEKEDQLNWVPSYRMPEGDECRRNDKFGVTNVHQFYTKRNLLALSYLAKNLSLKEYFLLTAMLFRSTNLNMTVVSNYLAGLRGKSKGGWAGRPMNGTLYLPTISTEVSVLESLKSRQKSLSKLVSFQNKYKFGTTKSVIQVGDATRSNLKENSVDYIFTDPPFGANIMYSELNFLSESWLKVRTNNKNEAIQNRTQNKSLLEYQDLMSYCFRDMYRVLKPNRWMTVEFSNTSAAVWNAIQTSLTSVGFVVANVSGFDKKQGTFKSNNSPTAVKQDLVISCYKPSSEFDEKFKQHQNTDVAIWDFVEEHLHHLPVHLIVGHSTTAIIERSPKILFDRLIAFYVQKGLPVPIDAGKFQQGLRERFIERDGMFFTNEQVQEYDKKKKENPEFIQLSILVSSEQDGVLWLKTLLTDKSLTYQDIQPEWMQALAGVRKGDVIPELATILEENFLKDDAGRWYTPDPENEADLEKLRTKRLLRQFDGYKDEANKPRVKRIKEVRVEALRAGFKQCYQDKDFKSIVAIGDKIPNNLLMEDELLLQFYDIASSRV